MILRILNHYRQSKARRARQEAYERACRVRGEAYADYIAAVRRRDTRDQHSAHRVLVARVNDVLRLENAA